MNTLLCRFVLFQARCQGICPVTPLLGDRCSVCCCSLSALTEPLQHGDSSSHSGCGAHKKESCWAGWNKVALHQAFSLWGCQLYSESWDLVTAFTIGKERGKEKHETKISLKAIIICLADLMDWVGHMSDANAGAEQGVWTAKWQNIWCRWDGTSLISLIVVISHIEMI